MIGELIHLLIIVVIVGFIVWLALWALAEIGLPEPFARVARVLVIIIAFLVVLMAALPLLHVSI